MATSRVAALLLLHTCAYTLNVRAGLQCEMVAMCKVRGVQDPTFGSHALGLLAARVRCRARSRGAQGTRAWTAATACRRCCHVRHSGGVPHGARFLFCFAQDCRFKDDPGHATLDGWAQQYQMQSGTPDECRYAWVDKGVLVQLS